ncbi:hypothetical protein KCP76_19210 [Salmonella enterica subsp. enterica serovar Weltevreden]|nr:hypothetical protein KCP76_19210 [Salmonella enterica subsp. enterica serovar Weltevreden]
MIEARAATRCLLQKAMLRNRRRTLSERRRPAHCPLTERNVHPRTVGLCDIVAVKSLLSITQYQQLRFLAQLILCIAATPLRFQPFERGPGRCRAKSAVLNISVVIIGTV